jgi:transposase
MNFQLIIQVFIGQWPIFKLMKGFILTNKEIKKLKSAHRSCKDKRFADRLKSVVLLGTGWTVLATAEVLLLDKDTVRAYAQKYQQGGIDSLLTMGHKGSVPKLNPKQLKSLDKHLEKNVYTRVQDIVDYVEQTYCIFYSVQGMTDLLKRLGYVYKKPKKLPGNHPDVDTQLEFIDKYEELKQTKGQDDPIYFMDGVHPQHNSVAACGWIKRGTTKTLESNTGRRRVNINGVVNIEQLNVVTEFAERVNAQSTIALFKKLLLKHRKAQTIYIICDNARYYRSRLVKEFIAGTKIVLVFLPPYCPNLNLIERLWKYFRKEVLYNKYREKFSDFEAACHNFFDCIKEHRENLRTLLTENFQIIKD